MNAEINKQYDDTPQVVGICVVTNDLRREHERGNK
jgi:hypothetical protein